jgi:hypothetical protein
MVCVCVCVYACHGLSIGPIDQKYLGNVVIWSERERERGRCQSERQSTELFCADAPGNSAAIRHEHHIVPWCGGTPCRALSRGRRQQPGGMPQFSHLHTTTTKRRKTGHAAIDMSGGARPNQNTPCRGIAARRETTNPLHIVTQKRSPDVPAASFWPRRAKYGSGRASRVYCLMLHLLPATATAAFRHAF